MWSENGMNTVARSLSFASSQYPGNNNNINDDDSTPEDKVRREHQQHSKQHNKTPVGPRRQLLLLTGLTGSKHSIRGGQIVSFRSASEPQPGKLSAFTALGQARPLSWTHIETRAPLQYQAERWAREVRSE